MTPPPERPDKPQPMDIFYRDEHHVEYAPTTRSHLQELLLTKQISDLGEVRREGSDEWLPILAFIRLPKGTPAPVPLSRTRAKWKHKLSSFMGMMNDPSYVKLVAGFAILLVLGTIYQIYEDKPRRRSSQVEQRERTNSRPSEAWYEGGTLRQAKMSEWSRASCANRLATSADFVAVGLEGHWKDFHSMAEIKPIAIHLEREITESNRDGVVDNLRVSEIAAACWILITR